MALPFSGFRASGKSSAVHVFSELNKCSQWRTTRLFIPAQNRSNLIPIALIVGNNTDYDFVVTKPSLATISDKIGVDTKVNGPCGLAIGSGRLERRQSRLSC